MPTKIKKNAHIWERDPHDWYVEPIECSLALFAEESYEGRVWDPACGLGRIIEAAESSGLEAFGTDLIERSSRCVETFDFLYGHQAREFTNIVSNPPFKHAEEFVIQALCLVPDGGKVTMLLPLVWLSGFSSKRAWLPKSPLSTVMPISPRPSMPPGAVIEAGIRAGNGTKDFAWFTWTKGYDEKPNVMFLNTRPFKPTSRHLQSGMEEV